MPARQTFATKRAGRLLVAGLLVLTTLNLVGLMGKVKPRPLSMLRLFPREERLDMLRYVDPLIGTVNGGHVCPGATLPYGMIKAVADTDSDGENAAGFVSDDAPVTGFSHLHDSGTGGSASLGNFPLFVHPGCPGDNLTACSYSITARKTMRVNNSVEAHPGYFSIELVNGVKAEMTATMHAALYRFTIPEDPAIEYNIHDVPTKVTTEPLIILDVRDISNTRLNGSIKLDEKKRRITGQGKFQPSFGQGQFQAYFCADFEGANVKNFGVFTGDTAVAGERALDQIPKDRTNPTGSAGGFFQFQHPAGPLMARVGISFISDTQACENGEREIPQFKFAEAMAEAEAAWSDKLSVIDVDTTDVSEDLQKTFWSGLYRSFLLPMNYTGENQLWESKEPYFDSFYCIWDSFRAQHPLLTILDPSAQAEMVRALLDIYRHLGHLPDCRMSFSKGYTQGGSNADVVIADAFIKNITDGIDWKTAYDAVLADAEITPQDWSVEGRGNIESWETYHYIAVDHHDTLGTGPETRTVSRTLEYAYDDYCISVLAEGLGHSEDAAKYLERSGYWKNVWNPEQKDLYVDADGDVQQTHFVGFPQPRAMSGEFRYQKTRTCSPGEDMHSCYFSTSLATYEGSPWLYSFYVPQDMAGLIDVFGGQDIFNERLDYFQNSDISYMGNEQAFLTVFQFHYGGRPGKSSEWVHNNIPSKFNSSVNGIPGNDDCAMGAFSSMAIMGFFPVAGQDVYLLTVPFFPEVRLQSRGAVPAVIRKTGEGIYIQSAMLNGERYNKNWITHDFFLNGGELELTVGSEESSDWGTQNTDLPPSHPAKKS